MKGDGKSHYQHNTKANERFLYHISPIPSMIWMTQKEVKVDPILLELVPY
jgi:hypothetical protein